MRRIAHRGNAYNGPIMEDVVRLCLFALALLCLAFPATADAQTRRVVIHTANDSFENVKQDVVDAIVKRGLVVDYTAHVGSMLERTAKDVGATKRIYSDAQSVQFCSATLSRRTMEADPLNVAFCPYVIFIYALEGKPNVTHVGYRPLPRQGSRQSRRALASVNELLDGIVREAVRKR